MDLARTLIELQEHDLAIVRLNKQLDEMPEKVAILQARSRIAEIGSLKSRTEAVLKTIDAAIKRHEDEIAVVGAKIDAEQAKLLSGAVVVPKELQAISLELDALKRRLDGLENDLMAQLQRREAAIAQVTKVDSAVAAGVAKEAELTERFKHRGGDIIAAIERENAAREQLLAAIPGDLRRRYDTVRAQKHGIAVGVLSDGMCSACRVGLPTSRVHALLEGPDVGTCPSCQRILIVRGE